MSNILNHNRLPFEFKLSDVEYWDFHLHIGRDAYAVTGLQTDCLAAFIDTTVPDCTETENYLVSMSDYTYDMCHSKGIRLENIGYTGVDNGLFVFDKNTITDKEFNEIYTNSVFSVEEGDCTLKVHAVDGNSGAICYPTSLVEHQGMICSKLNGGFYQGFFRTGDGCDYSVLPSSVGNGLSLEFEIKRHEFESECGEGMTTLNEKHPENKGIFFYIGTRAENKWIKYYGDECCGTEGAEVPEYETSTGIKIGEKTGAFVESDNKHLIYDRTCGGVTTLNDTGDEVAYVETSGKDLKENPFLVYNRSCPDGKTVHSDLESLYLNSKYKVYKDLWGNALAFQVLDDGSVGYKYLVKDCDSDNPDCDYKIESEYSYPDTVGYDEWANIHVRILPSTIGKMRLLFYVNGRLVLFSRELPMLSLRELDDLSEKQEGVSFNISLGGGTQGLCETVYGMEEFGTPCQQPLETEFGGSFIGYFKSFKFYSCSLNYNQLNENVSTMCGTVRDNKIYCGALVFNTKPSKTPISNQTQLIPVLNEYPNDVREIAVRMTTDITKKYVRLILAAPCSLQLTLDSVKDMMSGFEGATDGNGYDIKEQFVKTTLPIPTPAGEFDYDVWYYTFATPTASQNIIKFNLNQRDV